MITQVPPSPHLILTPKLTSVGLGYGSILTWKVLNAHDPPKLSHYNTEVNFACLHAIFTTDRARPSTPQFVSLSNSHGIYMYCQVIHTILSVTHTTKKLRCRPWMKISLSRISHYTVDTIEVCKWLLHGSCRAHQSSWQRPNWNWCWNAWNRGIVWKLRTFPYGSSCTDWTIVEVCWNENPLSLSACYLAVYVKTW